MTNCIRCNGIGHLGITGDNDTPCPTCGGTGNAPEQPVNTTATVEPLSSEAELRLQLANVDSAWQNYLSSDENTRRVDRKRFSDAMDVLDNDCDTKFHMLLDLLDAERQENARLKGECVAQAAQTQRFFGFYERVLDIIENGEPGKRFQQIEIEIDTL